MLSMVQFSSWSSHHVSVAFPPVRCAENYSSDTLCVNMLLADASTPSTSVLVDTGMDKVAPARPGAVAVITMSLSWPGLAAGAWTFTEPSRPLSTSIDRMRPSIRSDREPSSVTLTTALESPLNAGTPTIAVNHIMPKESTSVNTIHDIVRYLYGKQHHKKNRKDQREFQRRMQHVVAMGLGAAQDALTHEHGAQNQRAPYLVAIGLGAVGGSSCHRYRRPELGLRESIIN